MSPIRVMSQQSERRRLAQRKKFRFQRVEHTRMSRYRPQPPFIEQEHTARTPRGKASGSCGRKSHRAALEVLRALARGKKVNLNRNFSLYRKAEVFTLR